MQLRALIVLAVLAMATPQAHAIDMDWLIGGSIGNASMDVNAGGTSIDSSDMAWKTYAGVRFVKYFGLEGGYQDLGTADFSVPGLEMTADVTAWDTYLVGVYPIGAKFEVFGKAGFLLWETDVTFDDGITRITGSNDGSDVAYGAGGAFKATDRVAIRGEWERFTFDSDDISMFSVGVDIRF